LVSRHLIWCTYNNFHNSIEYHVLNMFDVLSLPNFCMFILIDFAYENIKCVSLLASIR
jgi:hypothetical protein